MKRAVENRSKLSEEVSRETPPAETENQVVNLGQMEAADNDLALQIDAVEEDVIVHEQRITDLELNPPIRVVSQAEYDALGDVSNDPTIYMIKNA